MSGKIRNRLSIAASYFRHKTVLSGGPIEITLESTAKCNLYCPMCPRHIYTFDNENMDLELYRKVIHRDSETLGMEICLPVWRHRAFIDAHRYDHAAVTTLLLVTTEETQLEHLLARKVATGDIGAVANTILVMGSERVGNRIGRFLCIVKHRGSAMSDEIAEYRVGEQGIVFP